MPSPPDRADSPMFPSAPFIYAGSPALSPVTVLAAEALVALRCAARLHPRSRSHSTSPSTRSSSVQTEQVADHKQLVHLGIGLFGFPFRNGLTRDAKATWPIVPGSGCVAQRRYCRLAPKTHWNVPSYVIFIMSCSADGLTMACRPCHPPPSLGCNRRLFERNHKLHRRNSAIPLTWSSFNIALHETEAFPAMRGQLCLTCHHESASTHVHICVQQRSQSVTYRPI